MVETHDPSSILLFAIQLEIRLLDLPSCLETGEKRDWYYPTTAVFILLSNIACTLRDVGGQNAKPGYGERGTAMNRKAYFVGYIRCGCDLLEALGDI